MSARRRTPAAPKAPSRPPSGPSGARVVATITLVLAVTVCVFAQVATFEFVQWDDPSNVSQNPYLALPFAEAVGHFWRHLHFGSYIPVTRTLWVMLWKLSPQPGVFHVANLVVHLANVLLVFVLMRRLGLAALGAGAGALLFAIHPVQVEPVAWVTGMKDVLGMFFTLLALTLAIPYLRPSGATGAPPHTTAIGLSTVCFMLAMLSKATAVTLPLLVIPLAFALGSSWRRVLPVAAVWAGLALPLVLATRAAESQVSNMLQVPLASRPLVMADAFGFYLVKLFVPLGLSPIYDRPPGVVMTDPMAYGFALVASGLAVLLVWSRRQSPWPAVAGAFFALALLPVSGLVTFVYQNTSTVADRYLYFAMLGPAIALAWGIGASRPTAAGWAAVGVVLLVLAGLSVRQVQYWRSDRALFERVLAINPRSAIGHNNLGLVLARQGRLDEAMRRFRVALEIQPTLANAHMNLGFALYLKGHPDSAIAESRAAVRAFPGGAQGRINLGLLLSRYGDPEEAKLHLREGLRLAPFDTAARGALERLESRPAGVPSPGKGPASGP